MIGADPNVAITVLNQGTRAEIGEAIPFLVVLRLVARNAAYTFVGRNPYGSIFALQKCAHEVIYQPARGRVAHDSRVGQAVDSAAIGTEPEITGAVPE